MRRKPCLQLRQRRGSDQPIALGAVLDQDEQRDALHAVAAGDRRCVVDVELDDLQVPGVLAAETLDER